MASEVSFSKQPGRIAKGNRIKISTAFTEQLSYTSAPATKGSGTPDVLFHSRLQILILKRAEGGIVKYPHP
jgi:hypothetical protein